MEKTLNKYKQKIVDVNILQRVFTSFFLLPSYFASILAHFFNCILYTRFTLWRNGWRAELLNHRKRVQIPVMLLRSLSD